MSLKLKVSVHVFAPSSGFRSSLKSNPSKRAAAPTIEPSFIVKDVCASPEFSPLSALAMGSASDTKENSNLPSFSSGWPTGRQDKPGVRARISRVLPVSISNSKSSNEHCPPATTVNGLILYVSRALGRAWLPDVIASHAVYDTSMRSSKFCTPALNSPCSKLVSGARVSSTFVVSPG